MDDFRKSLAQGQIGESHVARWLKRNGYAVLPVYEKILDTGKGPQLFTLTESIVAPDMQCFCIGEQYFVEAKKKSAFTWFRRWSEWQTGIDLRHYRHYLRFQELTHAEVWIMFLHERGNQAKDSPPCPLDGLFGQTLSLLKTTMDHPSPNHGRSGMAYWNSGDLVKLAELEEVAPELAEEGNARIRQRLAVA